MFSSHSVGVQVDCGINLVMNIDLKLAMPSPCHYVLALFVASYITKYTPSRPNIITSTDLINHNDVVERQLTELNQINQL